MSLYSTGSPKFDRKCSEGKDLPSDGCGNPSDIRRTKLSNSPSDPLKCSNLGIFQAKVEHEGCQPPKTRVQKPERQMDSSAPKGTEMERLLSKLSPKPRSFGVQSSLKQGIFTKSTEHQTLVENQDEYLTNGLAAPGSYGETGKSLHTSLHPAVNRSLHAPALMDAVGLEGAHVEIPEVLRLKQELIAANSKIALQEQELAQTRVIKHTLDQALGSPSEAEFSEREISEQTISNLQNAFNAPIPTFNHLQDRWNAQDDSQSDISDALSSGAYGKARGFWVTPTQGALGMNANAGAADKSYGETLPWPTNPFGQDVGGLWGNASNTEGIGHPLASHRVFSGPSPGTCNPETRFSGEPTRYLQSPSFGPRRTFTQTNRGASCFPAQNSPWGTFSAGSPGGNIPRSPTNRQSTYQQVGYFPTPSCSQRNIDTPLSPTATEFTSSSTTVVPWGNSSMSGNYNQTYISPLEPLNYRRLLDKNVSCDWRYIVDKIVCNNDQQASIFLQQKLKVGTTEQKYDIIEAIVHQAYPLMVNRFGNFLVQRCFEHGTSEQVVAIANAIKGNTLSLSMDPFGCHVIQKAFDCVPEEHKAVMVHELLRRIPETVIHRYACHVWQKLFELRWSGEPPQIMAKVNDALRGMWHEVALGETGSLVVQNIFENCVEDEKRPAIEEVLAKIDVLAHGQFGNWCIQHICEHGASHDKSRAIEHIIHWSVDYSMDQFASKIVEKCLKIGGPEFLDRYLTRVCTGRTDRPRMPLIDIAGDQYGNYLIQWILMNAAPHQRELVASHIRKHMVSLRGSKFGSRVAMLCCNPSHATRPGPGAGIQVNRFNNYAAEDRFQVAGHHTGRFHRGNQWNSSYTPFR